MALDTLKCQDLLEPERVQAPA
uniref:Uncharacterized protein n=1 Tax=Rhizophora mucronata TaxID=61149 RepID=A0A2P2QSY3_RHIMU